MKFNPEIVGQRFALLRKELDYSQEQLAKELNLSQTVISKAERGKGGLANFMTIILFFKNEGFNLDWLLTPDNTNIPLRKTDSEGLKESLKKHIDNFKL